MRYFLLRYFLLPLLAFVLFLVLLLNSPQLFPEEISLYQYTELRQTGVACPEVQDMILGALADDKINCNELKMIQEEVDAVILQSVKDELAYYLKEQVRDRLVRQNGERTDSRGQIYRPNVLQRKPCSPDPSSPGEQRPKEIQTRKNWVRSCDGYLQRFSHDKTSHQSKGEMEHDSNSSTAARTKRFLSQVASCNQC